MEAQLPPEAREALALLHEHCAAAGWQPLEVFTRSAQCFTHLRALQRKHAGDGAEHQTRLQRLQAAKDSLAMSCPDDSKDAEIGGGIADMIGLLSHQGIAQRMVILIMTIIGELSVLLDAERLQATPKKTGGHISFIACIDHMLPGEETEAAHIKSSYKNASPQHFQAAACAPRSFSRNRVSS